MPEKDEGKAKNESLEFRPADEQFYAGVAPHFVEWIRQQLLQKAEKYGFDLYRDGLSVYTTLDSRMQRYANKAVEAHLAEYQRMFDSTWSWKDHKPELAQVINSGIRSSAQYRDSDPDQRDSVFRDLRKNQRFIDSVKKAAQRIEV